MWYGVNEDGAVGKAGINWRLLAAAGFAVRIRYGLPLEGVRGIAAKDKDGLTAKQAAFANAVAQGKTLREAYQGAYNAGRMQMASIDAKAHEVACNPKVAAKIDELREQIRAEAERTAVMSRVEVLHELSMIASGRGNYPAYTLDGEVYMRAPSVAQRLKALELLGKHHQIFTDRVEVNGGEPFAVNITVVDGVGLKE